MSSDVLGVSANDVDYAVTTGYGSSILAGVHFGDVDAKMRALDAERSSDGDAVTYRLQPDDAQSGNDKLANVLPGVTSQFNVMRVAGSEVTFGPSTAALAAFKPTGPTIASDSYFSRVVDCLGDPLAAYLTAQPRAGEITPGDSGTLRLPPVTHGLQAVGLGVSGSAGTQPEIRMCVVLDSASNAAAAATSVRTALSSGHPIGNATPWSKTLTDPSVSIDGTLVTMTAHRVHDAQVDIFNLPGIYGPVQ